TQLYRVCQAVTAQTCSTWANIGGSGGGNTSSTSLTPNVLPKANGANSIINSSVSDNGTTVSTTEGFSAASLTDTSVTGSTQCAQFTTTGLLTGAGLGCTSGGGSTNPVILYASSTGNDSNSGLTWNLSKLTIAGACAAIPSGNSSCTAGQGIIYVTGTTPYFLPAGATPGINLVILASAAYVNGIASSGPNPDGIDIRTFGGRTFGAPPATITV